MFGRKRKQDPEGTDPFDPSRLGSANAAIVQPAVPAVPAVSEPDAAAVTTRVQFGGSTVIDGSAVPGLRDEVMKAVADARAGNPAAAAELQAAVLKAMSQGAAVPFTGAAIAGPSAPADPLDQLEKLNNLRLAGALTDAEFEAQKAKLLGNV